MEFCWSTFDNDWGSMLLISSQKGLIQCTLPNTNGKKALSEFMMRHDDIVVHRENSVIAMAKKQLREYFTQARSQFRLPLDLQGTDFQEKVWHALMQIPFGKTCCYQDIAQWIGNDNASRAVGSANHYNPLPIIIPCHRVVQKSGVLGGYAGGVALKKQLLEHELEALNSDVFSPHPKIQIHATA